MSENKVVPFTELVFVGRTPSIKVEGSIKQIEKMLTDPSPLVSLTDIDGTHYLLPKAIIKLVKSYDN